MSVLLFGQASVETVWRLQTHWTWAPWFTVAFVALAVALVAACYRLEATPAGAAYRASLAGLRVVTLLLLLAMLSEIVYSGARTTKPRLAVLVDRSESMQREDATITEASAATSREKLAKEILTKDDRLQQLGQRYDLQLAFVDSGLERVADGVEQTTEALSGPDPLVGEGGDPTATRLGEAIEALVATSVDAPLQGMLILTDGQNTAGSSLRQAGESARRRGVPIYAVGIGSEAAPPEMELADLRADDSAFVDDLVRFEAVLRTRGLSRGKVRVDLKRAGQGEPIATETFTIGPDDPAPRVSLLSRMKRVGEQRFELIATVTDGESEAMRLEPQSLSHTVMVRDDQARVLLAAGYPNYEFRFLKHLLERDASLDLSTYLQEADLAYAESDLTALSRFPLRVEELREYDAIVLIDLDPTLLPRSLWGDVAKYVSEFGGGLALVSGPRSLPSAYRGNEAFSSLMPTRIKATLAGGWAEPSGFQVTPTAAGTRWAAMQLADNPDLSDRVWSGLPPLHWRAEIGDPKPAAQVLATHPGGGGASAPLIVSQYYGAGRVLLHAMDSTWRWRYRVGDAFFARYWVQSLRELARGKQTAASTGARLTTSKTSYEFGESVRLRLTTPTYASGGSTVALLQSPGRPDQQIEFDAAPSGRRGLAQTNLTGLAPGKHRVVVTTDGDRAPLAVTFDVVAPPGEASRPEMNRAGLTDLADRTRGAFLTAAESDSLLETIPEGRRAALETLPPYELWNRWPMLLAITACLVSEWILRKRKSML